MLNHDLRAAMRLLARDPRFTVAAVLALGLGIAANNTVFTLVNAVLFRPLPFDQPDRVVTIDTERLQNSSDRFTGVSKPDLDDYALASRAFTAFGIYDEGNMSVSDETNAAERYRGAFISANAFSTIGQQPILGRAFEAADDVPGATPVVLLGHGLWQSRYRGDPAVIGRTIRVNGSVATVIGVMGDGMRFPFNSQLWQPAALLPTATLNDRRARVFNGFGRLSQGVTLEQGNTELARISAALAQAHPETNTDLRLRARPYMERGVPSQIATVFYAMLGAVGFVLLIACANVANLLLARAAQRSREISIRLSLGGSRVRVVRQLLVESLALAALGGLLGLVLSLFGVNLFRDAVANTGAPYWLRFDIDLQVVAYLSAVCLGAALIFGLAPALHATRVNVARLLNDAGRGTAGNLRTIRWTGALVAGQLALSLVLLTGAGLMIRTFVARNAIDPGIDLTDLMVLRLDLGDHVRPAARIDFHERLEERLRATPQLSNATLTSQPPANGGGARRVITDADAAVPGDELQTTSVLVVADNYFDALGISLRQGRRLARGDGLPGRRNVIVNERFTRMHFSGVDAIGRQIRLSGFGAGLDGQEWLTIVGVVANVRQRGTSDRDFDPVVYLPYHLDPATALAVVVRTRSDLASVASALRAETRRLDPDVPVFDVTTLEALRAFDQWPQRVFGGLFAAFASIALVLAGVGLYAVTTFSVEQRRREIGVRVALGAQRLDIVRAVTGRVSVQLAVGLVIGIAGAIAAAQVLRGLLIDVSVVDPLTLTSVSMVFVLVALAGCVIPARRAMRLDPVVALRSE